MEIKKQQSLKGVLSVPGDKSISHRAVMFGALASGTTRVSHFLEGADCLSTISCFRKMGIDIEKDGEELLIHGRGLRGLNSPREILNAGNSGTTTRLISGILAGQKFISELDGDSSLRSRPMKRIIDPLTAMGADIRSLMDNGCMPLRIAGRPLHAVHYNSPVASAQVKSCVLLAGLYAEGQTSVTEPVPSRDHTERMLSGFGAEITSRERTATVTGHPRLIGQHITIPGDISSAAYFIAAGLICPNSDLYIRNVNTNPTRAGILEVCRKMGGDIRMLNRNEGRGEPTADLLVTHSSLKGTVIEGDIIPTLIDELPVIAAMACFAEGETIIRDASELKVKESNRIAVMAQNLTAMGAQVRETDDGLRILGGRPLHGAVIDSHDDHRIAMTFAVAALCSQGETKIQGGECVNISYPAFYKDLGSLIQ